MYIRAAKYFLVFEGSVFFILAIVASASMNDLFFSTVVTKSYIDCNIDGDSNDETCLASTITENSNEVSLKTYIVALYMLMAVSSIAKYFFFTPTNCMKNKKMLLLSEAPFFILLNILVFILSGMTEMYQLSLIATILFTNLMIEYIFLSLDIEQVFKKDNREVVINQNFLLRSLVVLNYFVLYVMVFTTISHMLSKSTSISVVFASPFVISLFHITAQELFEVQFFKKMLPEQYDDIVQQQRLLSKPKQTISMSPKNYYEFLEKYDPKILQLNYILKSWFFFLWKLIVFCIVVISSFNISIHISA